MTISIALIVAAGRGHRASSKLPKQYAKLGNAAMLHHTVEKFLSHPKITHIAVVIHPDDIKLYEDAIGKLPILPPIYGGAERQDSVRNGLEMLTQYNPDNVLIHDGARPFVDHIMIDDLLEGLKSHSGVIPSLPVVDTLKKADQNNMISATISRENLWRAQTPQAFRYQDIRRAHAKTQGQNLTDDAAIFEAANIPVSIVEGSVENIKITTADDLKQANIKMTALKIPRIGTGFDVHRFDEGDFVTLCGVEIPHTKKLSGHSDADVALHAITDALLGAIGDGDIGHHFPPSEVRWKGAKSRIFAEYALSLINAAGGIISNIDITIICEEPKMGPHRDNMRQSLANMLKLDLSQISVKATTTEKLGFTGRGEGIAAQASALVMMP